MSLLTERACKLVLLHPGFIFDEVLAKQQKFACAESTLITTPVVINIGFSTIVMYSYRGHVHMIGFCLLCGVKVYFVYNNHLPEALCALSSKSTCTRVVHV